MSLICPEPRFQYIGGWWSPCTQCGQLAWDHEQADPLQDLRNQIRVTAERLDPADFPPHMGAASG